MAFGLWNFKKWGRYLAIVVCVTGIVTTVHDGMNVYGSLDHFSVFHIILIGTSIALAILFTLPAVKQIMIN